MMAWLKKKGTKSLLSQTNGDMEGQRPKSHHFMDSAGSKMSYFSVLFLSASVMKKFLKFRFYLRKKIS